MSERRTAKESGSRSSSSTSSGDSWKTAEEGLEEAELPLLRMEIGEKVESAAEKQPPGTYATRKAKILTNAMGVRLNPVKVFLYDVTVTGVDRNGRQRELSKRSLDDYPSILRKSVCFAAYYWALQSEEFAGNTVIYNGQSVLYALEELPIGDERTFEIDFRRLNDDVGIDRIEFKLEPGFASFTPTDVSWLHKDMREIDSSVLQYLDVATSQYPMLAPGKFIMYDGGRTYLVNADEVGFTPADYPDLSHGKFVAVGSRKSTIAVEGPRGRGSCNVAVLVDTSKTAFHHNQSVLHKAVTIVQNLLDREITPAELTQLRQQLIGLYAEKGRNGNGDSCTFLIAGVSTRNAMQTSFAYEGRDITVVEYYQQRFNVILAYPQLPLLVSRAAQGRESYFPMELCTIVEKQLVKQQQRSAQQLREMRNSCIVPPVKRLDQNARNVRALGLTDENNTFLHNAGLRVVPNPLVVDARILPPPRVTYGGQRTTTVDMAKMWSSTREKYFAPAGLKMWAVYLIVGGGSGMREDELTQFLDQFLNKARAFGLQISNPADMKRIQPTKVGVEDAIKIAKENNCAFVLFVQDQSLCLHDTIKSMERKYEIATQDLKLQTALDVIHKNKFQTLENIVNKLNMKLGGLNYVVAPPEPGFEDYLKDGRLIIGFASTHQGLPTRGGPRFPTVVGYAANTKKLNCEFVGDFGFQDARRTDNVTLIETFVKRIVEQYKRNRSIFPNEVVIYRSGVSEGEFAVILDYEVPLVRLGIREAGCDANVKVTMIVVSRLHNARLIPEDVRPNMRPMEQNCMPGTMVDQQLVHPRFSEFYLNSHKALQGTVRVPRYTVVVDDAKYSLDELEMMTYALCYCHQIVNLPTSVPTPMYIATRYAERGRRLMIDRSLGAEGDSVGSSGRQEAAVDLDEVNAALPFYGTCLGEARVNA